MKKLFGIRDQPTALWPEGSWGVCSILYQTVHLPWVRHCETLRPYSTPMHQTLVLEITLLGLLCALSLCSWFYVYKSMFSLRNQYISTHIYLVVSISSISNVLTWNLICLWSPNLFVKLAIFVEFNHHEVVPTQHLLEWTNTKLTRTWGTTNYGPTMICDICVNISQDDSTCNGLEHHFRKDWYFGPSFTLTKIYKTQ
jgi:hypothetical protein